MASTQFRGHIVIKVGLMGCFERGVECGVMDWEVKMQEMKMEMKTETFVSALEH